MPKGKPATTKRRQGDDSDSSRWSDYDNDPGQIPESRKAPENIYQQRTVAPKDSNEEVTRPKRNKKKRPVAEESSDEEMVLDDDDDSY